MPAPPAAPPAAPTRRAITEATAVAAPAPVDGAPGRFLIQIITPGWGSSGYYGADVLEAAGKAKVFTAGTHMYLDHPTRTEEYDRPERSVRDLAAVLNEDARWDEGLKALVAEATVFGSFRTVLEQMADDIGVSIRAYADSKPGEAEGRHGSIITQLLEGISVDFVTHAGRGGAILQVLESARAAEATVSDTRERLNDALRDAFGGDQRWVGVRDFDAEAHVVWFWSTTPDSEALFQLGYSMDDAGAVSLEGDPVEVRIQTTYVPVEGSTDSPADEADASAETDVPGHPAGRNTQEEDMPEIAESELRSLRDAAGRVQALEVERDTAVQERDDAVAERDRLREENAAATRQSTIARVLREACEAAASIELNEFERDGVAARAVVNDGTVDEAATRTAFDTAIAAIAEAGGRGRPRGLGGPVHQPDGEAVSEADLDTIGDATFGPIVKEA